MRSRMSSQGSPYARFRRSLDTLDPLIVEAAALEVGRLHELHDSLAMVLVMSGGPAERYERLTERWLLRLQETVALRGEDRVSCGRALTLLPNSERRDEALEILEQVMLTYDLGRCASEIADYQDRLDG